MVSGKKLIDRVAFRLVAMDFPTKHALDKYLKDHPDADPADHKVVEEIKVKDIEQDAEKKEQKPEEVPVTPSVKKEEEKKDWHVNVGDSPVPNDKRRIESPLSGGVDKGAEKREELKAKVEKNKTVKNPKRWSTHKISKNQITPDTKIVFEDGTFKKYVDLSAAEKEDVLKAIGDGFAISKGFADYNKEDVKTYNKNKKLNLAKYEDKSIPVKPLAKAGKIDSSSSKYISDSVEAEMDRFSSALAPQSRTFAKEYVSSIRGCLDDVGKEGEGRDTSMDDIDSEKLDSFLREDVSRIIHQEEESMGRSLGGHGAGHIGGNISRGMKMFTVLSRAGMNITARQKMLLATIMVNHDNGYTVGEAARDPMKGKKHKEVSVLLAKEERKRYEDVFGKEDTEKIINLIATHDSSEMDWSNDPLGSAVRLSDNTALFGDEKVQDFFKRSKESMGLVCQLKLAVDALPPSKNRTQEDVKLLDGIKKKIHENLNNATGIDPRHKESLHRQISEIGIDTSFTTKDILSRVSGNIDGFNYDSEQKVMRVSMSYTSSGRIISETFGDNVAFKKFKGFMENTKAISKDGKTVCLGKDGSPVAVLEVDRMGEYKPDEESDAIKEFAEKTARMTLTSAVSKVANGNVIGAKNDLETLKTRVEPTEWQELHELLQQQVDNDTLAEKLSNWKMFDFERNYLMGKTASFRKMVAGVLTRRGCKWRL